MSKRNAYVNNKQTKRLREADIDAAFLTRAASISSGDILSPEDNRMTAWILKNKTEIICIRYALFDKAFFDLAASNSNSFK